MPKTHVTKKVGKKGSIRGLRAHLMVGDTRVDGDRSGVPPIMKRLRLHSAASSVRAKKSAGNAAS